MMMMMMELRCVAMGHRRRIWSERDPKLDHAVLFRSGPTHARSLERDERAQVLDNGRRIIAHTIGFAFCVYYDVSLSASIQRVISKNKSTADTS